MVDPLQSMFPPVLSILRESGPRPGGEAASGHPILPFPFPLPGVQPPSLNDHPWENKEHKEHLGILNVALNVQCEDTRMVVSIKKESLQVRGKCNFHNFHAMLSPKIFGAVITISAEELLFSFFTMFVCKVVTDSAIILERFSEISQKTD